MPCNREMLEKWRTSGTYCSNAYLLPTQAQELLGRESVAEFVFESAALALEEDDDYSRLHYFAESPHALRAALMSFLNTAHVPNSIVVDILGKRGQEQPAPSVFLENGFETLGVLTRMNIQAKGIPATALDPCATITKPNLEDADSIRSALSSNFDGRISRLPVTDQIRRYIAQGGVYIASVRGEIAGIALFKDIESARPCLDQLLVLSAFRGMGLATSLIATAMRELGPAKKPYLWAIDTALSYYKRIGCVPDGLEDSILAYERR